MLESIDGGKPIRESRDVDVPLAAAHLFHHAGWADKLEYAVPGMTARPLGVVGQIIPWNFPLLMAAWKIAPALACGNTVVLKPAETTPLTALLLAELIAEAELPAGRGQRGHRRRDDRRRPGRPPRASTRWPSPAPPRWARPSGGPLAGTGTRLTLELGGKGAHVVFDDAALDQAVEGIVDGIFFNQGHVCCAGSRLLVQEGVADDLLERLRRRIELLRIGEPLDKNTDVGAINSAAQLERIRGFVDGAAAAGCRIDQPERPAARARLLLPAHHRERRRRVGADRPRGGLRPGPRRCRPSAPRPRPSPRPTPPATGSRPGVWTEKGSRILWISQRLRAGVVWANCFNQFDPASPFGGVRESGFGREGGRQGLAEYLTLTPVAA